LNEKGTPEWSEALGTQMRQRLPFGKVMPQMIGQTMSHWFHREYLQSERDPPGFAESLFVYRNTAGIRVAGR